MKVFLLENSSIRTKTVDVRQKFSACRLLHGQNAKKAHGKKCPLVMRGGELRNFFPLKVKHLTFNGTLVYIINTMHSSKPDINEEVEINIFYDKIKIKNL